MRFLFTVWPFAGHVHPSVAIAHALAARGHKVAFYSGVSVGPLIEKQGFGFFPFVHVNEERVTDLVSSKVPFQTEMWERLRGARELQNKLREWLLDTVPQQVEDLESILDTFNPDVVVCDSALWAPILVLNETRCIRLAVLSVLAACILPGPDVPAWGLGSPRPRNSLTRARATFERSVFRQLSGGFRAQVNVLRKRYHLPAIDISVTEFAGRMPLYLVPSAREYDYNRQDLPANVHYVGPCLWDKQSGAPTPEWLRDLSVDRPLIYVTEATIGTNKPFLLEIAARALRGPQLQVVMTTGKQRDSNRLNTSLAAPNIRVESYVPQSDLLPKTAVMVTLGGSGGVLAALGAGVPLIVVPTEWDRPENAQRVVEAGAGLRIAPDCCTPERLRAAVYRVLRDPAFRRNAQRMAQILAGYRGPARASELLEEFAANLAGEPVTNKGYAHAH